ncbi:EF-hand domain-containing protein [Pseudahrensia aquimaris]|uniref:EF-hand domain-containing protein n=1 Tax=Pseudahrensia aquimaris TaxID=744461 RepID=A0ABW3FHD5_9HYPH
MAALYLSQIVSSGPVETTGDKLPLQRQTFPALGVYIGGTGMILTNLKMETIMVNITKTSVAALTLGALLIGSTGAIAIAQSSNNEGPRAEHASWSGKKDRGHRRHHRGGKRGGGMMQMLRAADANNDGDITKEEIDTYRAAQVAAADANKDGNISLGEFETIWMDMTKQRMVRAFQRLDADGDGSVTQAERDAPVERMVRRMDRNGDGVINREDRRGRGGERGNRDQRGD